MGNYYRTLGLRKDATEDQIKAAYKKLALLHNPKRHKPRPMLTPSEHAQEQLMREQAEELESIQIFGLTAEAYDVLSDPMRKAIYDQFGERALKEGLPGPDGFIPAYAYHGDPFRTFREFFGTDNPFADLIAASCAPLDAFVGKDAQGFRPKQPSILKDLPITLAEAYNGTVKKLMINKKVLLNDGSGEIGLMDKVLTVKIPPGTPEGLEFSFPTEGDQDAKSTPADIVFVTKIEKHSVYRREGDNLIMTVDVNLCEALCGVLVRVDTLDDRLFHVFNVHVVQPGYEKVVPGEGMPVFGETDRKGDLIIRFKVKYPNKLTQDQKEKLKSALDPKNQVGGSVYDKKPPVTFHVSNKCFCPDDEDVTEAEKEKMMMRKKISSGNESSKKKRDIMGFEVAGEM